MKHFKENVVRYLEILKHLEKLNKMKKYTRKSFKVIKSVSKAGPQYFVTQYKEAKVDRSI